MSGVRGIPSTFRVRAHVGRSLLSSENAVATLQPYCHTKPESLNLCTLLRRRTQRGNSIVADRIRVGIVGATITPGGSGWGANAHVPALVAERYARSRIVSFSTACVYPFVPVTGPGAPAGTPCGARTMLRSGRMSAARARR